MRGASRAQSGQAGVESRSLGRAHRAGGQPQRRQEHRVQRPDRFAPAHRQLARQDHRTGRGGVRASRVTFEARRPARDLFAAGRQHRRGSRARLPAVRTSGRDRRRGRCHAPRTEPASGAADSGDLGSRCRIPESGGRGPAARYCRRRGPAPARAWRAGRQRCCPVEHRYRRVAGYGAPGGDRRDPHDPVPSGDPRPGRRARGRGACRRHRKRLPGSAEQPVGRRAPAQRGRRRDHRRALGRVGSTGRRRRRRGDPAASVRGRPDPCARRDAAVAVGSTARLPRHDDGADLSSG